MPTTPITSPLAASNNGDPDAPAYRSGQSFERSLFQIQDPSINCAGLASVHRPSRRNCSSGGIGEPEMPVQKTARPAWGSDEASRNGRTPWAAKSPRVALNSTRARSTPFMVDQPVARARTVTRRCCVNEELELHLCG